MNLIYFFAGLGSVVGVFILGVVFFRMSTVRVEDETAAMFLSFGRLKHVIRKPGLHFHLEKIFPWVKVVEMSLQRDFREYYAISLNDRNGTNVMVDLWLEFRVENPEKALFEVEDWEGALKSLVVQSATSILCSKSFQEILVGRNDIASVMFSQIAPETNRWGIQMNSLMIKNVGLPPDVSRRILGSVSAKLERAKALIEEEGRLQIEKLEAQTESDIAALNAEAKSQYSLAVGRAYHKLSADGEVFSHYKELYELSRVVPNRMVYFDGFADEIRAIDAAMISPIIDQKPAH